MSKVHSLNDIPDDMAEAHSFQLSNPQQEHPSLLLCRQWLESSGFNANLSKKKESCSAFSPKIELLDKHLWEQLNHLGTEMIISKKGRRMFPYLRVRVDGFVKSPSMNILLEIARADDNNYKRFENKWVINGQDHIEKPTYCHPDSRNAGELGSKMIVSFKSLKMTNKKTGPPHHVALQTMRKYVPCLVVFDTLSQTVVHRHVLWEAEFIAVTSYQNELVS